MGFGALLALVGLVAIALPIWVHLTKNKQAPIVWVGHIKLLKGQTPRRFKPTTIDNWPLFIVRLLIVIVATLALAKPFWQDVDTQSRSVAFLTPYWLATARDEQITQVTKSHDEILLLTPQLVLPQSALAHRTGVALQVDTQQVPISLWAVLSYLDEQRPWQERFTVYASEQMVEFFGPSRATFSRPIHWQLSKVQLTPPTALRVLIVAKTAHLPLQYALELLGYQVMQQSPAEIKNVDVVFDLDNLVSAPLPDSKVIKLSNSANTALSLAQPYHSEFVYQVRELMGEVVAPYQMPSSLYDGTVSEAQLKVDVDEGLYLMPEYRRYVDTYLLVLLVLLWMIERLMAEYKPSKELADDT